MNAGAETCIELSLKTVVDRPRLLFSTLDQNKPSDHSPSFGTKFGGNLTVLIEGPFKKSLKQPPSQWPP